mgnify:CR=1 FL=1|tara:strand:+ start:416 stop:619 length:204 start_codon:yes stop_codon:yes gene_type:complete
MSNQYNDEIMERIAEEVYSMSRIDKIDYLITSKEYYYFSCRVNLMSESELFQTVYDLMWENHPQYEG